MKTLRYLIPSIVSASLVLSAVSASAQDVAAPVAGAHELAPPAQPRRAKNVILFLADAGGVPVISAASLLGYGEPQRLSVQQWPHLGLSETSPVDGYVSDSANGMSSIVTGVKTHNGVISQGPDAVRGRTDGTPTKTVLEYAEEHGLMTGVISTQNIADATPAANYAHWNSRSDLGRIFPQAFSPRFGDGVDILMGAGRQKIGEQLAALGSSFDSLSQAHDRPIYSALADVPSSNARPVVVADNLDVRAATLQALEILERSPNGYFLMVEWDAHTNEPRRGLQNVVDFDRLIAEVQSRVDLNDTLLLFTADHSFGLQVDGGRRGEPLLEGYDEWKASRQQGGEDSEGDIVRLKYVMVNDTHTGEEVPALAIGAGAERVRGYFPNTYLFKVMMDAWGWTPDSAAAD